MENIQRERIKDFIQQMWGFENTKSILLRIYKHFLFLHNYNNVDRFCRNQPNPCWVGSLTDYHVFQYERK